MVVDVVLVVKIAITIIVAIELRIFSESSLSYNGRQLLEVCKSYVKNKR